LCLAPPLPDAEQPLDRTSLALLTLMNAVQRLRQQRIDKLLAQDAHEDGGRAVKLAFHINIAFPVDAASLDIGIFDQRQANI
jgi:hypothetical protein